MVSSTELKFSKLSGGSSELSIHLYGVPPILSIRSTISSAKYTSRIKTAERKVSLSGSSASVPSGAPKFLKSCHTRFNKIRPMPRATNTLYIVSAAGKYLLKVDILQPSAPSTDEFIRSRNFITCSANHSTIPSNIPICHPLIRSSGRLRKTA